MSENYGGVYSIKVREKSYGLYRQDGKRIAHLKRNPKGNDEIHIDTIGKHIKFRKNETELVCEIIPE